MLKRLSEAGVINATPDTPTATSVSTEDLPLAAYQSAVERFNLLRARERELSLVFTAESPRLRGCHRPSQSGGSKENRAGKGSSRIAQVPQISTSPLNARPHPIKSIDPVVENARIAALATRIEVLKQQLEQVRAEVAENGKSGTADPGAGTAQDDRGNQLPVLCGHLGTNAHQRSSGSWSGDQHQSGAKPLSARTRSQQVHPICRARSSWGHSPRHRMGFHHRTLSRPDGQAGQSTSAASPVSISSSPSRAKAPVGNCAARRPVNRSLAPAGDRPGKKRERTQTKSHPGTPSRACTCTSIPCATG